MTRRRVTFILMVTNRAMPFISLAVSVKGKSCPENGMCRDGA